MGIKEFIADINDKTEQSAVGSFFKLKERNTSLTQEIRGGLVTFLTISYILAVNAGILSQTGGTCVGEGKECPLGPGSLGDTACSDCVEEVRRSLISATAAACVVSHFLMGVFGNLPLAVAPAMGLNAYFAFTVVGFMGTGSVTYEQALAAVFVEGFIFIVVSVLGVRSFLVRILPRSIMLSTSAGIGLFLAHIGLQGGEGLGVVTYEGATLVTLGGCAPEYQSRQYTFGSDVFTDPSSVCAVNETDGQPILAQGAWVPSANYACSRSGVMRSATMWLGICGGMIMAILMSKNVKGAIVIGILFVTFISWIPSCDNAAAYLGDCAGPMGASRKAYFDKVVDVPDTSKTAGKFDFSGFSNGDLWVALITFLYVDFLDATGTLYSMANFLSLYIPNFIDEKTKKFERQLAAFCVDGVSIVVGACLGSSPITIYIESASGIREGARTGLAALTIMFCFIIALFFTPLLASIPPYATGPALILVGSLMLINVTKINWANTQEAVPAFLTIAVMPLTYSIAYGVIAGIISYIWINGFVYIWNLVQAQFFPATVDERIMLETKGDVLKTAHKMTWYTEVEKTPLDDMPPNYLPVTEYSAHPRKAAGGDGSNGSDEKVDNNGATSV